MNSNTIGNWPEPLDPAAFHGLAGQIVETIAPHSEADPAALLGQFLVALGNVVGRHAHFQVEATCHYLNLFLVLVGDTAKARKGTSWDHIRRLFEEVERESLLQPVGAESWADRLESGLSSGEGLIWAVRDAGTDEKNTADLGVQDKRRLVVEGEFASPLKMTQRAGNTLSPVVRNAWDSGNLQTLTKNSPARATGAYISIVGHITREELRRELTTTEQGNGFANRFLWMCVKRSRLLPGGCPTDC